ncbi:Transcription factor IIIA [Camelus dromedarius]|uniref:Transcription factor IIIA n=1 Tax=Camelus dromedarius TaxID=9838 RepID=A0A5N4D966_CAMDR|nr:Transcription factor IIIA [Camelus dromedarius]
MDQFIEKKEKEGKKHSLIQLPYVQSCQENWESVLEVHGSGGSMLFLKGSRHVAQHVAQHVAECLTPGALEPPASVAEAVSSLTITDAFVAAGESPAPPPRAPPRRFICSFPDCSANYNKAWKLDAHLCKHTGERPFVCSHEGCGKAFVRDYHLSRHSLVHTGEKPFVCTHEGCGKHFSSPSSLKRHGKVHEEEITCDVCQKTFKRRDYLKQHMKTHAPERDVYRCSREGCGRTYTTVFNLQSHILSFHEEQRPFVCGNASCGKTFAMKQSLTRHAVVHDPDKKKMKLKVKPAREKRSLASRLSGYIPPKRKQDPGVSLPRNGESLDSTEGCGLDEKVALPGMVWSI